MLSDLGPMPTDQSLHSFYLTLTKAIEALNTDLVKTAIRGKTLLSQHQAANEAVQQYYRGLAEEEARTKRYKEIDLLSKEPEKNFESMEYHRQDVLRHIRTEKWAAQMRFCVMHHQVLLSYVYRAGLSTYPKDLLLGSDMSSTTLRKKSEDLGRASDDIDAQLRNNQNIPTELVVTTGDEGIFAKSWRTALKTCGRIDFSVPIRLPDHDSNSDLKSYTRLRVQDVW